MYISGRGCKLITLKKPTSYLCLEELYEVKGIVVFKYFREYYHIGKYFC